MIPKPGTTEERPLGIPCMIERARQMLVKLALEAEWEAVFETNTYGFRTGRGAHDAIRAIFLSIKQKDKYVLDADISKCFDKINQEKLLTKLNTFPSLNRQIKAWLKSGVILDGQLFPTNEGTPQGGCISPLLALVALYGLETAIRGCVNQGKAQRALSVVFYADDFVVLHPSVEVILKCKLAAETWLKEMSLELKPSKTRISHTLTPYEGNVGFDFLGFNIRQYSVGKHQSGCHGNGKKLGFKTLIKPSKKKVALHIQKLRDTIDAYKTAPQAALISKLNPIIRGWCNYYSRVCSKQTFSKCEHILLFSQLRAWARYRTGNFNSKTLNKYWHYIEDRLTFSTRKGVRLTPHSSIPIVRHIKVKGDKSFFDGDVLYWSTRKGKHPELPNQVASLLKRYKGKCPACGLLFIEGDLIEVDHKIPKVEGGTDRFDNLQPLHRHCHDVKTALDNANRKALEQETELEPIESVIKI